MSRVQTHPVIPVSHYPGIDITIDNDVDYNFDDGGSVYRATQFMGTFNGKMSSRTYITQLFPMRAMLCQARKSFFIETPTLPPG